MGIIKVMDVNLSNKIAAGEVVEKLMNVVKELVENSLDAKADNIKISLQESGIKSIKVVDNGIGMTKEDALSCLERHATSKIYDEDALLNIDTLGFRGEAIPSIASVSKMTIDTSNGDTGTIIKVEGGNIKKVSASSLRCGTSIEVNDIFFNTPARLKYLKSLYSELANIVSYINKMALAFPGVSFSLINNDKVLLKTDGSGNTLKVINSIYGLDVTKKMVKFDANNDDYEISGYLSYPEINRASRDFITLIVNNRSIRNNDIVRAILDSYHTYLPKDKTPIVVLYIQCDPSLIDVNIHPTKMDVKFSKKEELMFLINNEITKILEKLTLIPEVKYEDRVLTIAEEVTTINNKINFANEETIKPNFEEITFDFNVKEEPIFQEERFKMIEPLCLIHGTYIVGENEDGLYILDQHAVNERINYEFYKKELGKTTTEIVDLLIPIKLEFSNTDYLILKEHFDIIKNLNIDYEEFGGNTLIIRSHPSWIKKDYVTESLRKIMEVIIQNEDFSKEKFNENIAITLACKMSIKANEHVSLEELKVLIERLKETANPFTCPHGRPTVISSSNYELEKLFKRVMS